MFNDSLDFCASPATDRFRSVLHFPALIQVWVTRRHLQEVDPDHSLLSYLLRLLLGNTMVLQGQMGDIIPPACAGSASGAPFGCTCSKQPERCPRGILVLPGEPPQMPILDVEEQQLCSEGLLND